MGNRGNRLYAFAKKCDKPASRNRPCRRCLRSPSAVAPRAAVAVGVLLPPARALAVLVVVTLKARESVVRVAEAMDLAHQRSA